MTTNSAITGSQLGWELVGRLGPNRCCTNDPLRDGGEFERLTSGRVRLQFHPVLKLVLLNGEQSIVHLLNDISGLEVVLRILPFSLAQRLQANPLCEPSLIESLLCRCSHPVEEHQVSQPIDSSSDLAINDVNDPSKPVLDQC